MNATDPYATDIEQPALLIVDDDLTFCRVLARAMEGRGYAVTVAHDVVQAIFSAEQNPPKYAVVDLRMPGPSGLTLVKKLKELDPEMRVVVLTGYASIATAIEAIKIGATHYLAKPVKAEEIIAAFRRTMADADIEVTGDPLPVSRVEWEYIQKVLLEHQGNITDTAKALGMHRRTLQRKLAKRPPRV
jgi:two-component system, response regulator RegA